MKKSLESLEWFPMKAAKCLSDVKVQTATPAEFGAYMKLLLVEWVDGPLPDDDEQLAILSGARSEWGAVRGKVRLFFSKTRGGKLVNRKLERVRKEQLERRKSYEDRGKRGASARWNKHSSSNASTNASSNAQAMPSEKNREEENQRAPARVPYRGKNDGTPTPIDKC